MTTEQAKSVLHNPDKVFVLVALSFVNLGDFELDLLIYRHLRKHTQFEAAEKFDYSVNGIQSVEKEALTKCAKVWSKIKLVKENI